MGLPMRDLVKKGNFMRPSIFYYCNFIHLIRRLYIYIYITPSIARPFCLSLSFPFYVVFNFQTCLLFGFGGVREGEDGSSESLINKTTSRQLYVGPPLYIYILTVRFILIILKGREYPCRVVLICLEELFFFPGGGGGSSNEGKVVNKGAGGEETEVNIIRNWPLYTYI